MPLYEALNKNSTPEQIAAAYGEFTGSSGGDTVANQNLAQTFLQGRGIATPVIGQAYNQFLQPAKPVSSYEQTPAVVNPTTIPTGENIPTNLASAPFYQTPAAATIAAAPVANQSGVTDAQFASYIKNNNLSGIGLQEAASVFGVDQDQILRAQQLLSANDPSVKAANDAYAAQIAGRPDLAKQNLGMYNPLTGTGSSVGVDDLYTGMLGQNAKPEEIDYWKNLFGDSVDVDEREQFRKSYATDINKLFGVTGDVTAPTIEGILSGFKDAKNLGLSEDALRRTLGEDAFKAYKSQFSNYAKTGIASILADKKLSFDEASTAVRFGREYGYDSQKLADLTGQKKELFDTINKTYDDTTNKIVDSVLGAEDVKTDGDKIVRALALQQRYGFSDEDLAKAADFTPAQVKEYLEPTRNYGAAYKEVMSKPDVTGNDILGFLEESKKNQGISTAYGSNIDAQIAKLNELNDKWKGFKDGYQAENIYNQVNKITEAAGGKNWSGSWRSGGDNAAKETTRILLDRGVDNLSDLGVAKNYERSPATREFYNGELVRIDEDGRKYTAAALFGEDAYPKYLPPDAKTVPAKVDVVGGGEEYHETYRPLTEQELKTYDPKTKEFDLESGNKLIDKSTGNVIGKSADNRFTLDSYETGNFFKGKSKQMGIMMTEQGIPVPYQTTEKEGLVYSPVFPIMLSMLAPGVASAISGSLPGAAVAATGAAEGAFLAGSAPTMANTIATNAIMGGGVAGLTGQDVLKGAFFGGIGAPLSAGISSLLPSGLDQATANALTSGGTNLVKGVLQGKDFEDLLGQEVLSGIAGYGMGQLSQGVGNTFNLTPEQLNLFSGIASPLIQGKNVNFMDLIGPLAKYGQQQTTKVPT